MTRDDLEHTELSEETRQILEAARRDGPSPEQVEAMWSGLSPKLPPSDGGVGPGEGGAVGGVGPSEGGGVGGVGRWSHGKGLLALSIVGVVAIGVGLWASRADEAPPQVTRPQIAGGDVAGAGIDEAPSHHRATGARGDATEAERVRPLAGANRVSAPHDDPPEDTPPVSPTTASEAPAESHATTRQGSDRDEPELGLEAEARAIERMRRRLASDPRGVLRQARQHEVRFPDGILHEEASVLSIEALARLDDSQELERAVAVHTRRYPASAYGRRIERAVTGADRR